jgi:hypothetical protein
MISSAPAGASKKSEQIPSGNVEAECKGNTAAAATRPVANHVTFPIPFPAENGQAYLKGEDQRQKNLRQKNEDAREHGVCLARLLHFSASDFSA